MPAYSHTLRISNKVKLERDESIASSVLGISVMRGVFKEEKTDETDRLWVFKFFLSVSENKEVLIYSTFKGT